MKLHSERVEKTGTGYVPGYQGFLPINLHNPLVAKYESGTESRGESNVNYTRNGWGRLKNKLELSEEDKTNSALDDLSFQKTLMTDNFHQVAPGYTGEISHSLLHSLFSTRFECIFQVTSPPTSEMTGDGIN